MAALTVEKVSVTYGSVRSLDEVSIEVDAGETVGLVGPNGAGKTTMLNVISGLVRCEGRVVLDGQALDDLGPSSRARRGLGRTFQTAQLFESETARSNLAVAREQRRRKDRERLDRIVELTEVGPVLATRCSELTGAERVRVEIARALATRPRVLLLDEPGAGLIHGEIEELKDLLRRLHEEYELAILLIDHNMDLVLEVSARVYVLDYGRMLFSGDPDEVRSSDLVLDAYLGRA